MKKTIGLFLLLFSLGISANQASNPTTNPEIQKICDIMAEQEKAWNRGDLQAFMSAYWQSEELTFVGKSGLKLGWQTTLDNYIKSYPDKAAMGKLKFTPIKLEQQENSAFVLGKWELKREKDNHR